MAFGIDDALMAAAAGISLTDTVVKTVKGYRKKGVEIDIERLIGEVRLTALQRIEEADRALAQLENTLTEKKVENKTLLEAIRSTPFWRPDEQHRLKRIKRGFDALALATYDSIDDIAALVRCKKNTQEMGAAVVESAEAKHSLHQKLLDTKSVKEAIHLLRAELVRHKEALS